MKNSISILVLAIFLMISCTKTNQKEKTEGTGNIAVLTVSQVMETPEKYIDNQISVEGMVTHVCRHGGKRLHLTSSGSDEKLRVRAGKDMTPFERELEGSSVILTGEFTEEKFDEDYLNKLKQGTSSGEHHESSDNNKPPASQGVVSEAYIHELEQKIKSSEKGYISEYWLTAKKIIKPEKQ